ncbi:uncharacterized protein EI90DRAFT_3041737 [Cantharellus anzutake]|uniref:uncharacterized protein n=1 Tax=Cantharellus anzutake TaxID=1750568 RepID=UPI0019041DAE|nr:uncharacterized protein EI90DRAFT_3041737 [Cantharellus anzutake]KAF8338121.1 hypothetical protein EI90DRAFT_3041737 [Cantharellus anzutake]
MSGSHRNTETIGLTHTLLTFSSRSVRNTTISLSSSVSSFNSPTPLYVTETPKNLFGDPPNTIYRVSSDGKKEHVATLIWSMFRKDQIIIGGETKELKQVLPMKGFFCRHTMPTLTGDWVWKTLGDRPELFNASGKSVANYYKIFRYEKKNKPPAEMVVAPEAMAMLDMVIIGLLCSRQVIRRSRRSRSG